MDWIKWMGHAIGVSEGAEAQISEPVAKLRYLYKVYTETRGEEVNTPSHTHTRTRTRVPALQPSDTSPVAQLALAHTSHGDAVQKKEVALSRVIQLFIAIFGHKYADGGGIDDGGDNEQHAPGAGPALAPADPTKPDLERSFGRQARELSLVLSFMFVNQIKAAWPANMPRCVVYARHLLCDCVRACVQDGVC
jgi:hypothetical protein